MDFVQAVLIVLLAVLAIGAVIWPMLRPTRHKAVAVTADQTLAELTAQRDAALRAVKDLEFDFQTGKVSGEDYPVYAQALKEQAVAAIQAVDDYQNDQRQAVMARQTALDVALEAEIAAMRRTAPAPLPDAGGNGHPAPGQAKTDVANMAASQPPTNFCPQCGNPVKGDDRFCAHCGTALAPVSMPG